MTKFNQFFELFSLKSKNHSQLIQEEEAKLSQTFLEILDINQSTFILKLNKDSKITLWQVDDWELLPFLPPILMKSLKLRVKTSQFTKEYFLLLRKFGYENPYMWLVGELKIDTQNFEDLTQKLIQLSSLNIKLSLNFEK